MKRLFLLIVLLVTTSVLYSYGYEIKGIVLDGDKQQPMPKANVSLLQKDAVISGALTTHKGSFEITNIKQGSFTLKISYIGYKAYEQNIDVTNTDINLGKILLQQEDVTTETVVVTAKSVAVEQKGDTAQYNATAFKTNPDASAEDLIKKMPGITVDNNEVKAQGESIKKVLVDGKQFFGNDPNAALKNLPAEVIDKIQVFDKQSDQAQFTGFDDGNSTKTMNIITKMNMRDGVFGKIYGGYGTENKYDAGLATNYFNGDRRLSIIGQFNNVNKQNFAIEDLVGAMGGGGRMRGMGGPGGPGGPGGGGLSDYFVSNSSGISTVNAIGINYSDQWASNLEVSGSYFFNSTNTIADGSTFRDYLINTGRNDYYTLNSNSESDNTNHRLNFEFEWDIDTNSSLKIRPRATFQLNSGTTLTNSQTFATSGLLNSTSNDSKSDMNGYTISNDITYNRKLSQSGRSISATVTTTVSNNSSESYLEALTNYYGLSASTDSVNQFTDYNKDGTTVSGTLMYSEPLVEKEQFLVFSYQGSLNKNESDKNNYDFSYLTNGYSSLDTSLSNVFDYTYFSHKVGTGWRYQTKELRMNFGIDYQSSNLKNNQTFPVANDVEKTYQTFLPNAMVFWKVNKEQNMRLNYRTRTNLPSAEQLQDVLDNTDPTQLVLGNSGLKEEYRHSLHYAYDNMRSSSSSTFFIMVNATFANNYVGKNSLYAMSDTVVNGIMLNPGTKLTRYENMDGYLSLNTFFTYGQYIGLISSNLNGNLGFNYSKTPGISNNVKNFAQSRSYTLGLTLSSNLSQNVDFTLSSSSIFSNSSNSSSSNTSSDYFTQNTRLNFNLILFNNLVFQTGVTHMYYDGLSSAYNPNEVLVNMSLGYKFLPRNAGELKLTINDLTNANQSVSRSVYDSYIEDVRSNVLKRYAMLTFTYTLKAFQADPNMPKFRGGMPPPPPPGSF